MPKQNMSDQSNPDAEQQLDKVDINQIINDAPLFAGLDDYILSQAQAKKQEKVALKSARGKEKKKNEVVPPPQQPESAPPLAKTRQRTSKSSSEKPLDHDAILLSVKEMCQLLKISRATLVRMDKAGKLPGRIKMGGSVRFHRQTVDNWLKSLIEV